MTLRYPNEAGSRSGALDTSREAAEKIEASGLAPSLRTLCLNWFEAGNEGTSDECATALGKSVLAIRPRISELRQAGLIEATKEKRANQSGLRAFVMRAVPKGGQLAMFRGAS